MKNIKIVINNYDRPIEAIGFVKKKGRYQLMLNSLPKEFWLKIKHNFWGGKKEYRHQIKKIVQRDIKNLNSLERSDYVLEDGSYSKYFYVAQKYNHLSKSAPINPTSCPELAPIKIRTKKITTTKFKSIPKNQQPYIQKKGLWNKHKVYHYNKADTKIDHGKEAMRIFINTQTERLISLTGRILENSLGIKIALFNDRHYFRKKEDKKEKIYARDLPLCEGEQITSYWPGHATCFLSIPFNSIKVTFVTDPIEADINKLLYPRMTAPWKMENCPLPHVFMLSHNHLDHYSKSTILKLKKYQPVMIVPEGDKEKLINLGFKNVYAMNWWQSIKIPIQQNGKNAEVKISAVPSRHWSGQGPCDGHHSAFLGFVIHKETGDIYFGGDTARLSKAHIRTMRERFNIRRMFQPGGPDEARKEMQSTHQASADGLWMHFNLSVRNLYEKENYSKRDKQEFIQEAKKLRTLYMHTMTFKLGNLHYDDTKRSIKRIKRVIGQEKSSKRLKAYEKDVYKQILKIGEKLIFKDKSHLNGADLLEILNAGVFLPKIGSRTDL